MVPSELIPFNQWVIFRSSKIALDPKTGKKASSVDPQTWADYATAQALLDNGSATHIGFVFHTTDPFCLLDLDNKIEKPATAQQIERHDKILSAFKSYAERSVSGRGLHIIIKASVPSGVDRDNVAIYSQGRYVMLTGDMISESDDINDHHDLANLLWKEAGGRVNGHAVQNEILNPEIDEAIIARAMSAANSEKFVSLCNGDISEYPSQSEADLALLSILCFYTQDDAQAKRIFLTTELGKRKKAKRVGYLESTIAHIRSNEPKVDFSQFKLPEPEHVGINGHDRLAETEIKWELPPGLVGELAAYFYSSAIRPVPEIALVTAIGFMAGIAGRSYNISGTGLNQYLVFLGNTGVGKEGIASGMERIVAAMRLKSPMADRIIGPASFASGQGLVRTLAEKPCFVSVLGEFGLLMQQLSDERASGNERQLKRVLLDLYTKSGWGRMLQPTVYSDTIKNTQPIHSPAVTLIGEATPESFYETLSHSNVIEGFASRFSVVEYTGPRPPRNKNAMSTPSEELVVQLCDLSSTAVAAFANNAVIQVEMMDDAKKLIDSYDAYCDGKINSRESSMSADLYNRGHLKLLKLSALLAVGKNIYQPVIDGECAAWAKKFIDAEIERLLAKCDSGEVSKGDWRQHSDLLKNIEKLLQKKEEGVFEQMRLRGIVAYRKLMQMSYPLASFRNDKMGASFAFDRAVKVLLTSGELEVIPPKILYDEFKFRGKAFGFNKN